MAPELNDHDKEITEKIDAYSLGVILYLQERIIIKTQSSLVQLINYQQSLSIHAC